MKTIQYLKWEVSPNQEILYGAVRLAKGTKLVLDAKQIPSNFLIPNKKHEITFLNPPLVVKSDGLRRVVIHSFDWSAIEEIESKAFAEATGEAFQILDFSGNKKLKKIGEEAFIDCKISKVILPPSLSNVEASAFVNAKVKEIDFSHLPNENEIQLRTNCFAGNKLTEIDMRGKNIRFGAGAFQLNESLERVVMPSPPEDMFNRGQDTSSGLFQSCSKLSKVENLERFCHFGDKTFKLCTSLEAIELPTELKVLGKECFANSGLKHIAIPASVISIRANAFQECESLETVEFEDTQDDARRIVIGGRAFTGCSALKSIALPEGLETLSMRVFEDCENLEEVTLPNSLRTFEKSAFLNCTNLRTVHLNYAEEVRKELLPTLRELFMLCLNLDEETRNLLELNEKV